MKNQSTPPKQYVTEALLHLMKTDVLSEDDYLYLALDEDRAIQYLRNYYFGETLNNNEKLTTGGNGECSECKN